MMTVLHRLMQAGLCAALCLNSLPAQDKPAGPAPNHEPKKPTRPAAEKVAFLGLVLSPVDESLAAQLGLPPGVGVLVRSVMPDSPAANAGVRNYDVLHYFNDQLLVNEPQLQTLVHQAGIGKEVKLTLLRQGKSEVLTVTLGEHAPMEGPGNPHHWGPEGFDFKPWWPAPPHTQHGMAPPGPPSIQSDIFTDKIRDLQERLETLKGKPEEMREAIERFQRQMQDLTKRTKGEMRQRSDDAIKKGKESPSGTGLRLPGAVSVQVITDGGVTGSGAYSVSTATSDGNGKTIVINSSSARTTWSDAEGSGELVTEDGSKKLTIKDPTGKVTFSGPVDTEDQRKNLPPQVRERLERIEKGVKVEIQSVDLDKKN